MISVLTQERLLGAALGSLLTSALVFDQRRRIHNSIYPVREPVLEKKPGLGIAHFWNTTVDRTFGPLIESVSSRGW